jgi:hypothetical protein
MQTYLKNDKRKWEEYMNSHPWITLAYHFFHLSKSLLSYLPCLLSFALQMKMLPR